MSKEVFESILLHLLTSLSLRVVKVLKDRNQLGLTMKGIFLLPTGSEEREVLGFGSIPVAILPSCQDMKIIALQCRDINVVG